MGLKGSAAKMLVPDPPAHLRGSGFEEKGGPAQELVVLVLNLVPGSSDRDQFTSLVKCLPFGLMGI